MRRRAFVFRKKDLVCVGCGFESTGDRGGVNLSCVCDAADGVVESSKCLSWPWQNCKNESVEQVGLS